MSLGLFPVPVGRRRLAAVTAAGESRLSASGLCPRLGRWLAIGLLLLNLLAGVAVPWSKSQAGQIASIETALLAGQMVICTASGMVLIGQDGRPVDDPDGRPGAQCAFCLPLWQAGNAAPAVSQSIGLPVKFLLVQRYLPLFGGAVLSAIQVFPPPVRGPPPSLLSI